MFEEELLEIGEKGLLRRISDRQTVARFAAGRILIDGVECLNFSSNDYLGLASSEFLADAAGKALESAPFGAGASRLLSGGTQFHSKLESSIASFKGTEGALIFNSGYQANTGIIPSLCGHDDVIFSDELNHASIIDGCRLSRARTVIYNHRDMGHLANLMKTEDCRRRMVVTDTVFSMDGDIAPLGELFELLSGMQDAILYLDDAHGTGVLGGGRGALAHFGIRPQPWIVQMGTFSKALGSFGAFATGSREMIDLLINSSRSFIFSTALPSCVAAASAAALSILETDKALIERLWSNQKRAVEGITEAGFKIVSNESPIIAVLVGDISETMAFAGRLRQDRIYAPAIRPPTVKQPRIRITVSAAHTEEDVDAMINAFSRLG